MAIYAQITNKDESEPRKIRWGWWHLNCIADCLEQEGETFASVIDTADGYVVKEFYKYMDPADGEILEFNIGDKINLWLNR